MGDAFVDFLLARRSVRRFTDAPVTQEHLELATKAGQRAPTSSWIQGMTLINVEDPALKTQLCEIGQLCSLSLFSRLSHIYLSTLRVLVMSTLPAFPLLRIASGRPRRRQPAAEH